MSDFPVSNQSQDRVLIRKSKANPGEVDTGNRQRECGPTAKNPAGDMAEQPVRNQARSDEVFAFQEEEDTFERKNANFYTEEGAQHTQNNQGNQNAEKEVEEEGKFFAENCQTQEGGDRICLKNQKNKSRENAALDQEAERVSIKKPKSTY